MSQTPEAEDPVQDAQTAPPMDLTSSGPVSIEDPEERFGFGENWLRYLELIDDEKIRTAEQSLRDALAVESLHGLTFLDIGSGSGLFSLAARNLGAKVHSFDFDPNSVASTAELRRRYHRGDADWTVEQGSALDGDLLASLGTFDVVYSWGVLHHTGHMWDAIRNARGRVKPGGTLFIALYNDCGWESRMWVTLKRIYCALPKRLQPPYVVLTLLPYEVRSFFGHLVRGRFGEWRRQWSDYGAKRGMDRWRDAVDWVGGYPYEYASLDATREFLARLGMDLEWATEKNVGLGCLEFRFRDRG